MLELSYSTLLWMRKWLGRFTTWLGYAVLWIPLTLVTVITLVVFSRYLLNVSQAWSQEIIIYLHGLLITSAMGYTLAQDGHVRLDIFWQKMSDKVRAWVELATVAFCLIPLCYWLTYTSIGFVGASWSILEKSAETGGLPFIYLHKSMLYLLVFSLGIATLNLGVKALITLLSPILGPANNTNGTGADGQDDLTPVSNKDD